MIGSLVVVLAALMLSAAPASAATTGPPDAPYPPPGSAFAFEVKGSNGYELGGLAFIGPVGKPGQLLLIARSKFAAATYAAPATVTAEMPTAATIEADLGKLGRVSLTLVPSGRQKSVRVGCEGHRRAQVEAARYEGAIEFHGEEGFTDVSATSAPVDYDIYREIFCYESFASATKTTRGARLGIVRGQPGEAELYVSASKERRAGKTLMFAGIKERRGRIAIRRELFALGGAGALSYTPDMRTATLRPPAPFSGQATFRRDARRAGRWTGTLAVDFPGRSGVALTGSGLSVDLTPPGP